MSERLRQALQGHSTDKSSTIGTPKLPKGMVQRKVIITLPDGTVINATETTFRRKRV